MVSTRSAFAVPRSEGSSSSWAASSSWSPTTESTVNATGRSPTFRATNRVAGPALSTPRTVASSTTGTPVPRITERPRTKGGTPDMGSIGSGRIVSMTEETGSARKQRPTFTTRHAIPLGRPAVPIVRIPQGPLSRPYLPSYAHPTVGQDEASGFAHDYPATDEVTLPAACGLDRQGTLEAFGASSRSV